MFLRFAAYASVLSFTALPHTAWADPAPVPAPQIPDVNQYTPRSPADYAIPGTSWYAFAGPPGVTCVINRQNGDYGCSGALPGAPDGANLVSAGPTGPPRYSTTERPLFSFAGAVKPLPPNTRLSFREVSCGVDGIGAVACVNSRDQVGFVVGPAGSHIDTVNPMLDRPPGTPILPGLPPIMPAMPPPG